MANFTITQTGSGNNEVYRQVYALYEQLLGRDPDAGGFAFWTGSGGAALGQMADSFLTSPEAFNIDFVTMAVYQAATGAPPSFAQYTAVVAALRAGSTSVTGLFNSLIGHGGYNANTLYANLLNRLPSTQEANNANPNLANAFAGLVGYPNGNTPVQTPNNEFQSTDVFHGSLSSDHSNGLYTQMLYYVILPSRDPTPAAWPSGPASPTVAVPAFCSRGARASTGASRFWGRAHPTRALLAVRNSRACSPTRPPIRAATVGSGRRPRPARGLLLAVCGFVAHATEPLPCRTTFRAPMSATNVARL